MTTFPVRKIHHLSPIKYQQPFFYFVTICTENFTCYFGEVKNYEMHLNDIGKMVKEQWLNLPKRYPTLELDKFVVMPNHLHGILNSDEKVNIHEVMKSFKSLTTNCYIGNVKTHDWPRFNKHIWEESYYDHIILNEADYERIWTYIDNNPGKWEFEKHQPGNFYEE